MQTVSINVGMDVSGVVSGAARAKESLKALGEELDKAKGAGDTEKTGVLYMARDRLTASSAGFDRDMGSLMKSPMFQSAMDKQVKGQSLSKSEELLLTAFHNLSDEIKKNTDALAESMKTGDANTIFRDTAQLQESSAAFHNLASGRSGADEFKKQSDATRAVAINQISGVLQNGLNQWVDNLDRSGIISQYASGDVLGARLSEQRRESSMVGGAIQSISSGIGGMLTMAGPAGALAGSIVSLVGATVNTLMKVPGNLEATKNASIEQWRERSGPAMELAALTGDPTKIWESFDTAAVAAERYGYSAEEGVAAMQQSAKQGLSNEDALRVTQQVFDYERRTGADRETMSSIANLSTRYGGGDALKEGWAGLGASGMKTGQYDEYLRAMQRVMEDGISKGFVRSSEQTALGLTMISEIGGGDKLWQGEQGARRLMGMDAGLQSSTALEDSSDMLVFQAAKELSPGAESYVDIQKLIEQGLTGDEGVNLYNKTLSLITEREGEGNREGFIEQVMKIFNLSRYEDADKLWNQWKESGGEGLSKEAFQEILNAVTLPPDAETNELQASREIEAIKNTLSEIGKNYWDTEMTSLRDKLEEIRVEYNRANPESRIERRETERISPEMNRLAQSMIDASRDETQLSTALFSARGSAALRNVEASSAYWADSQEMSRNLIGGQNSLFTRGNDADMTASNKLMLLAAESDNFIGAIRALSALPDAERRSLNAAPGFNQAIMDANTWQDLVRAINNFSNMRTEIRESVE